jgi:hypothetical protein
MVGASLPGFAQAEELASDLPVRRAFDSEYRESTGIDDLWGSLLMKTCFHTDSPFLRSQI